MAQFIHHAEEYTPSGDIFGVLILNIWEVPQTFYFVVVLGDGSPNVNRGDGKLNQSLWDYLDRKGVNLRFIDKDLAAHAADTLNAGVKAGDIVMINGEWIALP